MNALACVLTLLALLGQEDKVETTVPEAPEVVRVLTIEARTVPGQGRYLDPSLEPARALLERVPGNQFRELGFHEIAAHYGLEASARLAGGYDFVFHPRALTEHEEILFDCRIDTVRAGRTVEALRVSGKASRGQGAVFRGLKLPEGELIVIVSIAREDEEGQGGQGGSGGEQGSQGSGAGADQPGPAGAKGAGGAGDDGEEQEPFEVLIPELQSRESAPDEAEEDETVALPEADGPDGAASVPDLAAVEGILRALEEQDLKEQKAQRNRRFEVIMRGNWW